MQISQEQLKKILQNKPMGVNNRDIVEGLIGRGYDLEGLDPLTQTVFREQKKASTPYATEEEFERPKAKGFWGKARDFAANIIGGGKLAEGVGQAIASPSIIKNLEGAITNVTATQSDILQKIKDKRMKGEDVSREMELLKLNKVELDRLTQTANSYTDSLVSNKQVVSSAGRLAGTLAGGTLASKAAGLTGVGKATSFTSGALRGAGAGAIAGGIEGGIQAGGVAGEQDRSSEEIVMATVGGAAGGALLGGALGTLTGGYKGAKAGKKLSQEKFYQEFAREKLDKKASIQAIKEGRLKDAGFIRKAEAELSKRDTQLGEAIKDIVDPKAPVAKNTDALLQRINEIDTATKDYIRNNNIPFNEKQLRSALETAKSDLNLVFASDKQAEKVYNALTDTLINKVDKKNALGLFEARQGFDNVPAVKKLLESAPVGENLKKQMVLAVRKAANNYVADLVPEGEIVKGALKNEHLIFESLENVAEKYYDIIGKNQIQLLTAKYPLIKWGVGGLAAGGASLLGGRLFSGALGFGGAAIGSSD